MYVPAFKMAVSKDLRVIVFIVMAVFMTIFLALKMQTCKYPINKKHSLTSALHLSAETPQTRGGGIKKK